MRTYQCLYNIVTVIQKCLKKSPELTSLETSPSWVIFRARTQELAMLSIHQFPVVCILFEQWGYFGEGNVRMLVLPSKTSVSYIYDE